MGSRCNNNSYRKSRDVVHQDHRDKKRQEWGDTFPTLSLQQQAKICCTDFWMDWWTCMTTLFFDLEIIALFLHAKSNAFQTKALIGDALGGVFPVTHRQLRHTWIHRDSLATLTFVAVLKGGDGLTIMQRGVRLAVPYDKTKRNSYSSPIHCVKT